MARLLALVVLSGSAGAALGLLKHPTPPDPAGDLLFGASAAVASARAADERARLAEGRAAHAEHDLALATARIRALQAAEQEMADALEAERLGVARLMKDSTVIWGDERRRVMAAIVRESRRNGLDPVLTAAVIYVESGFNPFAVSPVGARGLMQIMPPTAQWLLAKDGDARNDRLRPAALFDPVLNVELGTTYLAQLMNRFDGDLGKALIAYNAGPGVARNLRFGSTAWRRLERYPKNVLATYRAFLTPPQQIAAR